MSFKLAATVLVLAATGSSLAHADVVLPHAGRISVSGAAAEELWSALSAPYTQIVPGTYQKDFVSSDRKLSISCTWTAAQRLCTIAGR